MSWKHPRLECEGDDKDGLIGWIAVSIATVLVAVEKWLIIVIAAKC